MKGAAKHRWIEQSKKEIIRCNKKEGFLETCDRFNIGIIALTKNLKEWEEPPNWSVPASENPTPIAKMQTDVASVRQQISTLQVENAQIRLELDKRLVAAGVQVTIMMV